jgi:hypothetical protein
MTYVCDWSLELPVIVGGTTVSWCPDVDCVLALDECGDLWKVGFKPWQGDAYIWAFAGPAFEIAKAAVAHNRESIMELCEIPSDVRHPPLERPEYTGPEYHPITF